MKRVMILGLIAVACVAAWLVVTGGDGHREERGTGGSAPVGRTNGAEDAGAGTADDPPGATDGGSDAPGAQGATDGGSDAPGAQGVTDGGSDPSGAEGVTDGGSDPSGAEGATDRRSDPAGAESAAAEPAPAPSVETDLPSLAAAYADFFPIGAAIEPAHTSGLRAELLRKHVNLIVAENAMKPASLQPAEGKFNWGPADRIVEFARENGMALRFHTLVWHNQVGDWFFLDPDGKPMVDETDPEKREANKKLLLERLERHVRTIVERYKDDIRSWDVVNEVVEPADPDGMRASPWYRIAGIDYIETAFRAAREAGGPDIKLYINDYGTDNPVKRDRICELVKELLDRGVPIDGVGHQTHISIHGPSVSSIIESMKKFSELGLDNLVTELDMSIYAWNDRRDLGPDIPEDVLQKQADRYGELFDAFREHRDIIGGVVFWGIADDHTWLNNFPVRNRTDAPLLFDRQLHAKPAFRAVVESGRRTGTNNAGKSAFEGEVAVGETIITNPVIWADVPDPSVIRVGSVFYMVSTSMHAMPGCPIMKSANLKDWEIAGYVFDTLEDHDAHNLSDGRGIYGKGSWAANLRYHDGMFYVCFSSLDMKRFYVYRTRDIEHGPWERSVIDGVHHDPSLLFDDGRVYVIHGNGDIRITELTEDVTAVKPGGLDRLLFETEREGIALRCEGCYAYKLNGWYYLFFIEWPKTGNRRRRQICYRSRHLLGPYERRMVLDDDMGYRNHGVAQGGIVDTPEGEWYAVLFQDHDAVGRVPCVVPVRWEDDWPVFGVNGKVPQSFAAKLPEAPAKPIVISDGFDYAENRLALNWQWNHNPADRLWSVTARPGYLRLIAGSLAGSVEYARNTLTQRTEGPMCSGMTLMEFAHMKPGDRAGLVALQHFYGTVGIHVGDDGARSVVMCVRGEDGGEETVEKIPYDGDRIWLKIAFDFRDSADLARFYYSADGGEWRAIGRTLQLKYTLDHFMGCRIGLFHYATRETGGYVDFDCFRYAKQE